MADVAVDPLHRFRSFGPPVPKTCAISDRYCSARQGSIGRTPTVLRRGQFLQAAGDGPRLLL